MTGLNAHAIQKLFAAEAGVREAYVAGVSHYMDAARRYGRGVLRMVHDRAAYAPYETALVESWKNDEAWKDGEVSCERDQTGQLTKARYVTQRNAVEFEKILLLNPQGDQTHQMLRYFNVYPEGASAIRKIKMVTRIHDDLEPKFYFDPDRITRQRIQIDSAGKNLTVDYLNADHELVNMAKGRKPWYKNIEIKTPACVRTVEQVLEVVDSASDILAFEDDYRLHFSRP